MTSPPYYFGSFNINDNINYFLLSKNLDFAEVKPTLFKIAHLDGEKQTGYAINSRQIQVHIGVVADSATPTRANLESKLDTLDGALRLKQQRLQLHALDTRYFTADCISAKATFPGTSPIKAVVQAVFLAQIPYAYAVATSTQNIANVNLTLVSGNVYKYADQTFAGGGTAVALPKIHLVSTNNVAWTQVQIFDNTDSRTLTITSNLPSATNDFIDIYCDPNQIPSGGYSVQKNGTTACAFNGVFPVLQPTNTSWTIQVTTGGSVPAGSAQWSWQARFMR